MCSSCISASASSPADVSAAGSQISTGAPATPCTASSISLATLAPAARDHWVFVYGTHKRGFACHAPVLDTALFIGNFRTLDAYPLIVSGAFFSPLLLNIPNSGDRVFGEVYAVDSTVLAALDRMENISSPLYMRNVLPVASVADPSFTANVHIYLASPELAVPAPELSVPSSAPESTISDYQCRKYIPRHRRQRPSPADRALSLNIEMTPTGLVVREDSTTALNISTASSAHPLPCCAVAIASSAVSSSASLADDCPSRAPSPSSVDRASQHVGVSMYGGSAWPGIQ
jgi:gamma-glutamylaminecyclotransferase